MMVIHNSFKLSFSATSPYTTDSLPFYMYQQYGYLLLLSKYFKVNSFKESNCQYGFYIPSKEGSTLKGNNLG